MTLGNPQPADNLPKTTPAQAITTGSDGTIDLPGQIEHVCISESQL